MIELRSCLNRSRTSFGSVPARRKVTKQVPPSRFNCGSTPREWNPARRWFGRSVSAMEVTQASLPASFAGGPPQVLRTRTETVLELAAGDGCATLPEQSVGVAIETLDLAHDVGRGFQ